MEKFSVGGAVRAAYGCLFKDIQRIVRISWPWLLMMGIAYAIYVHTFVPQAVDGQPPQISWAAILTMLGSLAVILYLQLVLYTLFCRDGFVPGSAPLSWRQASDPAILRVFLACLRLLGLMILAMLALLLIGGVIALIFRSAIAGTDKLIFFAIILYCVLIYVVLRVGWMIVPVAVAEKKTPVLRRSWALGRGCFWRMLAIVLAVALPIAIVLSVIAIAIFLSVWGVESAGARLVELEGNWYFAIVYGFIEAVVGGAIMAMMVRAQVYSYRVRTDAEAAAAPPPPDAV